jgi:hypothetical protein
MRLGRVSSFVSQKGVRSLEEPQPICGQDKISPGSGANTVVGEFEDLRSQKGRQERRVGGADHLTAVPGLVVQDRNEGKTRSEAGVTPRPAFSRP